MTASSELFPIRTVSSLTGVNAITLRAWERRHDLVRPLRTKGGHRLYRQADVDAIRRIIALLDKGISIGQVRESLPASPSKRTGRQAPDHWSGIRREMLEAIIQFDEYRLEDAYDGAQARFRNEIVTREVLTPLMSELGARWSTNEGSVAEEHFFSAYLRNKLGARFHHRSRLVTGRRVIAACLPGEMHEAGLLLFCLAAGEHGLRAVLLGADMPLEELPLAVKRSHSDAIVLSGSGTIDAAQVGAPLKRVTAQCKVPLFVGGHSSLVHHSAIVAAGAVPLGVEIEQAVQRVVVQLSRLEAEGAP